MNKNGDLLGTLVHEVAHLLRLDIDRRLKQHNLTRIKWRAIEVIANKPQLSQAELASELGLGTATVGRLVDRLLERGFVVRMSDSEDRRAFRLEVTDKALKSLSDLAPMAEDLRSELLSGLSSRELSMISSGLAKLKQNLKNRNAAVVLLLFTCKLNEVLKFEPISSFGLLT